MCYGDSIFKTCPHCSSTDQVFEYHGCYSGSPPTKTWWILPCAIVEEIPVTVLCQDCLRCFQWLESLDADGSPDGSLASCNNVSTFQLEGEEGPEYEGDTDLSSIASMARWSCHSDTLYTSSNHLKLICEWYDAIEDSLRPLKQAFSAMSTRCIATRNPDLIFKLGILEAEVEITLANALKKLQYVIETNTWIRQTTDDEGKLKTVDVEELRAAMFEMRMSCIALLDDEDVSAEAITKRFRESAYDICDALRAAEEEIAKEAEVSGRLKTVDKTGEKDLLYLLVGLFAYHGRKNETRRQTSPGSSAGTVVTSYWSIGYPADFHLDADVSRYRHYHYLPFWIHHKRRWKRHLYWLHNHHYVNVELAVIFFFLLLLLSIKRKFLKFEQQQFQRQFLPFVFKQQQRIVVKQFECFILNKQYRCPDYRLLIQFVVGFQQQQLKRELFSVIIQF
ncbi:hypothetical protein KCU93_g4944, partial [Aureobasidium melanogenum]